MKMIINTPVELEDLPNGTHIEDGDYLAVKIGGAWFYPRFGTYWEPEQFPVTVIGEITERTP